MNRRFRVWVPPDGDSRLVRFQAIVAECTGRIELVALPPHLSCEAPGRVPSGPLRLGTWTWVQGVPAIETFDALGSPGSLYLGLPPGRPWTQAEASALPPVPPLAWTRGRLAVLNLEWTGDRFALWSWEEPCGWRSDRPTA